MRFFLVPFIFVLVANAANDWKVPCINGRCSYDLETSGPGSGGSMVLTGTSSAISDITSAGGWMILDCDPNAISQDIRIVCMDEASGSCSHLHTDGAIDTLVRLPQTCGKMPFARLAREWDHEDQSLPNSSLIVRRGDGSQPVVKGMSLDANFAAIDPSVKGPVILNIVASNVPGVNTSVTATPSGSQRRSRLSYNRNSHRRAFTDFIGDSLSDLASFDENQTKDLPPVDICDRFNILNSTLTCGSFSVGTDVNVDAEIHAVLSIGVTAKGTIVPPKLDDFAIVTGLDADLQGTLDIILNATGTISSGKITLFEVGIPGLDIPGILSIGPSLQLKALVQATVDLDLDFKVDLNFKLQDKKLYFPPQRMNSSGSVKPAKSHIKLSASPSVNSTTTLEAHLIPTINLGINALGVISANVFAEIDTSTTLALNLAANTTGLSTGTNNTDTDFSGSVNLAAGIAINIGADDSFLNLFKDSTSVTVFNDSFQLFETTFGDDSGKKRGLPEPLTLGESEPLMPRDLVKRLDLTCPSSSSPLPVLIFDKIVDVLRNSG